MAWLAFGSVAAGAPLAPGWGVDACLTRHVSGEDFPRYLDLLRASGVKILREREVGLRQADGSYRPDLRAEFGELHRAGLEVVAFASPVAPPRILRAGDSLPEDLREVFALGQTLRRDFSGSVDAWEMTGEPDVGFCRDLPERLAAYQKALYLGLKAGAGSAPKVLMGALALPPGPWLERAARNGLLDYTDAYNFHFYGRAGDLAGTIRSHRAFMDRWTEPGARLPLWITECGAKTVPPGDFLNPARRGLQAAFTVDTARQARDAGAAVFMPFILVDRGDPYALTLSADRPLPAWTAYAALTRSSRWPVRPLTREAAEPDPVVLQWLPDAGAAVPHKVSGTYRFDARRLIAGEIRIYNLGAESVSGRFEADAVPGIGSTFPRTRGLSLAPGQMVALRGAFSPPKAGYAREWWSGRFRNDDGRQSRLYFGLEATPEEEDFQETSLKLTPPPDGKPLHPIFGDYRLSARAGPWVGINGVKVDRDSAGGVRFASTETTGDPVGDPLYPPMAMAEIDGLPREGFLLVKPDRMLGADEGVRVDLVDAAGSRFTIWENFGQSYPAPRRVLWLNLADFHAYFWGSCPRDARFRPDQIREMQLRFYGPGLDKPIRLDFALARPR